MTNRFLCRSLILPRALALACLSPSALRAQQSADLPSAPEPTEAALRLASPVVASPFDLAQTATSPQPALQQNSHGNPNSSAPSLEDLGLTPQQTKADPDAQARLDRRSHMLKVHQTLGLVTMIPLAAACISSAAAPPDPRNGSGNITGRDIHAALGSLSVAMYGATAYYAIKAPRIHGEGPARGGIKLHKYLIYAHAPGMVLTPILGYMAFNQANNGERVHGIASAHSAVAWTTVATYTASIIAVSWPIHLPFGSNK